MWLLTAGPTREYWDDVRFLSNASSGRMGYALAEAAAARGHEVVVVAGPVDLPPPAGAEVLQVTSAREMLEAARLMLEVRPCSVLVGVAAVCDYRPKERLEGKPPKGRQTVLELVPNPDVLASLAALGIARVSVGFALEDLGDGDAGFEAALARARDKRARKRLDAIVLNGVSAISSERSRAWWVAQRGPPEAFGDLTKAELAAKIVERLS